MCKNTHRYFNGNFIKIHLKRNGWSNILIRFLTFICCTIKQVKVLIKTLIQPINVNK